MSEPTDHWQKLARLARQVPKPADAAAPFGFATRVAARWVASESPAPSAWDVLELFSMRSLVVAGALMFAAAFISYDVATPGWTQQFSEADASVVPLLEP